MSPFIAAAIARSDGGGPALLIVRVRKGGSAPELSAAKACCGKWNVCQATTPP
jgi:hypothetical protein